MKTKRSVGRVYPRAPSLEGSIGRALSVMHSEVAGSNPAQGAMEKLYIIVRADLPAGAQVAQSCHAMRLFVHEHPDDARGVEPPTSGSANRCSIQLSYAPSAVGDPGVEPGASCFQNRRPTIGSCPREQGRRPHDGGLRTQPHASRGRCRLWRTRAEATSHEKQFTASRFEIQVQKKPGDGRAWTSLPCATPSSG